jgi:hypothetical protein
LFRPIRWEEDDALPFTDRIRNPTWREPMHYVIPRVLWSGFVDGVVEIYLTFTIRYERGSSGEVSGNDPSQRGGIRVKVTQEMEPLEHQTIPGDTRFRVHPDKLAVVEVHSA